MPRNTTKLYVHEFGFSLADNISRVFRASDCHMQRYNGPGFNPSILDTVESEGAADDAEFEKNKKIK
jgi:hypothetical protein